ncbi:hypothetical protein ACQB6R_04970 [Propionibacteriaceae bacterium G1746]|uniref:hypothetical protein n=1 Tax=Aestuariimicrobium sp. G57 TaxID=3418485 RepID=UPI003C151F8E
MTDQFEPGQTLESGTHANPGYQPEHHSHTNPNYQPEVEDDAPQYQAHAKEDLERLARERAAEAGDEVVEGEATQEDDA